MIDRKIHNVFLKFKEGLPIESIPIFTQQVSKTRQFCLSNDIIYKMWTEVDCNELINKYPQYKELYENFREEIQKIDFIRYLILYHEGGIYLDCDVCPINNMNDLFELDEFFVRWNDDKKQLPYIAVLGSVAKSKLYEDILRHCEESYIEKSKMSIYTSWIGRFVFQTTGHYMVNRVLKKYKNVPRLDILKINSKQGTIIQGDNPIFEDFNISEWFKPKNK
tara:strand:- start:184 stop:846 length:663 start_codon:yes stop_codon:yes gene_type:complete